MHAVLHQPNGQQTLALQQARRLWPRLKGLLGQPQLAPGSGLWLSPCNSVHSCFMRFSLDVLYLNRAGEVIALRPHLAPWRMSLCLRAHSVVELAAGEAQRLGINLGDQILCAPSPV